MKQIKAGSIPSGVKVWFGDQIQRLALEHDLAGQEFHWKSSNYGSKVITELRSRAMSAIAMSSVDVSLRDLEPLCETAAKDLIRLRRIRHAHETGRLSTQSLRNLPIYLSFRHYLEENPSLVLSVIVGMLRKRSNQKRSGHSRDVAGPQPDYQLAGKSSRVHDGGREWINKQILGFALAEDAWRLDSARLVRTDYISRLTSRIEAKVREVVHILHQRTTAGELHELCEAMAFEILIIRCLRMAAESGEISKQQLQQFPLYRTHEKYFEQEAGVAATALEIPIVGI